MNEISRQIRRAKRQDDMSLMLSSGRGHVISLQSCR